MNVDTMKANLLSDYSVRGLPEGTKTLLLETAVAVATQLDAHLRAKATPHMFFLFQATVAQALTARDFHVRYAESIVAFCNSFPQGGMYADADIPVLAEKYASWLREQANNTATLAQIVESPHEESQRAMVLSFCAEAFTHKAVRAKDKAGTLTIGEMFEAEPLAFIPVWNEW